MQSYEELVKEREKLFIEIQKRKAEANALPRTITERSAILADLAALRITYSFVQEEIMERFIKKR